jgi:uncharacterized protein YjiS (DUF1127 family)
MTIDIVKFPHNQTSMRSSSDWNKIWILRFTKAVACRIVHVSQARKDRKMLLSMSDSMLKDIGISRCDVYRITKQPEQGTGS